MNKKVKAFRLSAETCEILRKIEAHDRKKKTAIVELSILKHAENVLRTKESHDLFTRRLYEFITDQTAPQNGSDQD